MPLRSVRVFNPGQPPQPFCLFAGQFRETHERKVSVADNSSFDAAAEVFDALCVKFKGNGGRTDAELFKAFQRKGN